MAQLGSLIVSGAARFLNNMYGNLVGTVNGYSIAKSVPSNAVFTDTDTKVTAVGNHYTPTGSSTISASGGTATNATGSGSAQQVVTGVTIDAKGHVTAVTSKGIYSTDTDHITTATTSGSGNAVTAISASNGALTVTKGTTFLTSHQDISGKANLASPALTGTPTAPTATAGTNTTQIATTAFVTGAISSVRQLPSVTSSDSGKILRVNSSGAWVAESVPSAEGASF